MNLPMWKYQGLFNLMDKHPKFKPYIIITPCIDYDSQKQEEDSNTLIQYFKEHNIPYYLSMDEHGYYINVRKRFKPHLLFYPQPYSRIIAKEFRYTRFLDKLLCYYPYAFWTSKGDWCYDQGFHNCAWKLFYSTHLHYEDAKKYAYNKACNVEIVGYPDTDKFLNEPHKDVWKKQNSPTKRIIWAPHYSIFNGGLLYKSNFLWMADFMLEIVDKYADRLQFAFKPHPRLFSELCKHKDWGKDKAEWYYNQWKNKDNTQLEENEFIDLFMTSDAMIHDSQSFMVEYHYSMKPVMYITKDIDKEIVGLSTFGQMALKQHYIGKNQNDILQFIEYTILKGVDPMKEERESYTKKKLTDFKQQNCSSKYA